MKWKTEEHDHMVELLREGLSAAETGRALTVKFGREFSRNSVISRAHRRNVPLGKLVVKPRPRRKPKAKLALPGHVSPMPPVMLPVEPLPEDDPNDIPLKTFDDLGDKQCRQRIDGPFKGQPYGFCGRETVVGMSYCRKHAARNVQNWIEVATKAVKREKEPA